MKVVNSELTERQSEKEQKKKMVYNGVEYDWLFTLKIERIPIKEEVQDGD